MPPTLVNVAVGVLLGVALLGMAFDRRSLAVVAVAAALPDLDAALSLLVPAATNAALHNAFVPALLTVALVLDTRYRDVSRLRRRYGARGVRVAWVALAAFAVAGIGLDFFNIESVALLYPFSDRYYAVVGHLVVSSQDGLVQSYVQASDGVLPLRSIGTLDTFHVSSWLNPRQGPDATVERRAYLVESGWQFVIVLTAIIAVPIRARLAGGDA